MNKDAEYYSVLAKAKHGCYPKFSKLLSTQGKRTILFTNAHLNLDISSTKQHKFINKIHKTSLFNGHIFHFAPVHTRKAFLQSNKQEKKHHNSINFLPPPRLFKTSRSAQWPWNHFDFSCGHGEFKPLWKKLDLGSGCLDVTTRETLTEYFFHEVKGDVVMSK